MVDQKDRTPLDYALKHGEDSEMVQIFQSEFLLLSSSFICHGATVGSCLLSVQSLVLYAMLLVLSVIFVFCFGP